MKRCRWLPMLVLVFLCLPDVARADVGTPLMWAGILHMWVGNALIGLLEGLVIAWVFHLRARLCIPTMIAGNYFSAWIGGLPILIYAQTSLHLDISNLRQWMSALLLITYAVTLAMEWPFVAICFRRNPGWLRRSLWANLLIQTVSYAGLVGWYAMASKSTLYTDIAVVPASQMPAPAGPVIYYIAASDGDVYRQELPAGPAEKVFALNSTRDDDTLFVRHSKVDPSRWDLFARRDRADAEPGKDVLVKESFASTAVSWWEEGEEEPLFVDNWNRGRVHRLGDASGSHWDFESYWSTGLIGTPKAGGNTLQVLMETPLAEWHPCNATQLPGDQVVFQLGQDQICILDPQRQAVALVAHGRGSIVVLKDSPAASRPDNEVSR